MRWRPRLSAALELRFSASSDLILMLTPAGSVLGGEQNNITSANLFIDFSYPWRGGLQREAA
jgi:hypothetical protein